MLSIGDIRLNSRLIVGTGRYASFEQMKACHEEAATEMVTVAVRRVDLAAAEGASILDFIDRERIHLLPNTSGCYTPEDAVMTAQLAREAFGTNLVKVEVIGCDRTLFPDAEGTLEACRELVADGFTVLPYCGDDPVLCQRLEDIGCAAVMPLAAPIGSGLGLRDTSRLQIIRELVSCPVIVDAGIGTPSDAVKAMELGADAVLLNTAIAAAGDPVAMARAFRLAVEAGRVAHEAGRMPMKLYATASSPLDGRIA
jgi:thiazole synthase